MGDLSSCSYSDLNSFSLQRIAQLARAAMHMRLDGAFGLLQHLGNLAVGEAFDVAQHHGDAHMRRKPCQRGSHLAPQLGGFRGDIGPEATVVGWLEDWSAVRRIQRYHAQRTARYTIAKDVERDLIEPRFHAHRADALRFPLTERTPRAH